MEQSARRSLNGAGGLEEFEESIQLDEFRLTSKKEGVLVG